VGAGGAEKSRAHPNIFFPSFSMTVTNIQHSKASSFFKELI